MKEDYGNTKLLLQKINCGSYQWDICRNSKMLRFLLGLRGILASFFFGMAESLISTACRKYGLKGDS
jgi:hypothetical protein